MALTEQVTAWGTLSLALVALYQAQVTRRALAVTREDVREAGRARVDAIAPRVTITVEQANWPPHWPEPSNVLARPAVTPEHRYVLPRDASKMLYVAGVIVLRNDGNSTAVCTLPVNCCDLEGAPYYEPPQESYWTERLRSVEPLVLESRHTARLWFRVGTTVEDWIERRTLGFDQEPLRFTLENADTFADGIVDTTELEVRALLLVHSGQDDEQWKLTTVLPTSGGTPAVRITVAPTRRHYRFEARTTAR